MQLIASNIGLMTLAFLVVGYVVSSRVFALGALSLPCVLLMTNTIYFYLMPMLAFSGEAYNQFLGMYIFSLEWPHLAVGLYVAGALAACGHTRQILNADPAAPRHFERSGNPYMLIFLATSTVLAFLAQVTLGKLNAFSDENYMWSESVGDFAFINLFFTMMIPLATVYLIRDGFGVRSLIILGLVSFVLMMTGFRYRLVILAFAVATSFVLARRIAVRTPYVLGATLVGLLGSNAMGSIRKYGAGIDLHKLDGSSWYDILHSFGGEVGLLFTFAHTAENPLPTSIHVTPWLVAIFRLVPSFIWEDKPSPEYLNLYLSGFNVHEARTAGVAAPQHVEMLLQFGWIGLPILAFLYFRLIAFLIDRLSRLGREAQIATFALAPAFFGFYMPTRGYFFQILSDAVFTFAPLFLIYWSGPYRRVQVLPETVANDERRRRLAPNRATNR